MATATYPGAAGNTAKTEAATFIPEIWSDEIIACLLYTSPSPRDGLLSRMPSSA